MTTTDLAIGLDYDACVCHEVGYTYPFTPQNVGDINFNTSILDININLWNHILDLCRARPQLTRIHLLNFSARQSASVDRYNSIKNQTESCFLALHKILYFLPIFLSEHLPHLSVVLHPILMPDLYEKRQHGETFLKAFQNIDYSSAGRGMLKPTANVDHPNAPHDEFKTTLALAHMHLLPQVQEFHYLDDRLDILDNVHGYFSNHFGPSFFPADVKLVTGQYIGGCIQPGTFREITGTGQRCTNISDLLITINRLNAMGKPMIPTENHSLSFEMSANFRRVLRQFTPPTPADVMNLLRLRSWTAPARQENPAESVDNDNQALRQSGTISLT